jgi:RNA binding exosome subunit
MLYDVNTKKKITKIPHRKDYERWRNNISEQDFQKVFEELNSRIDQNEVHTSSWIPGRI